MRNQKDRVIRNANVPFSSAGFLPLAFLGLGIYRAWIEIVFVGSFVDFPSAHFATRDLFDIVMSIVLLGCALGARKVSPVLFETRRLGALRHAAHPRNRMHVFIIVLSRNRRTPCHRRVDCGRHRHCTHDPYLERALWMHEPHACGLLLFGVNYRRRPHDIYLPRFRHSMALRHDLDFADILAPVRRPKLQCASGRQSAKHHMGQVLRA